MNKPRIFANCPAGCKWEVPHKRDVEDSVAIFPQPMFDGKAIVDMDLFYKIEARPHMPGGIMMQEQTYLPTSSGAGTVACAVGEDVYIFGCDENGSFTGRIQVFNTGNGELTELYTKLPYALRNEAVASVGTNIYLFGGYDGEYKDTILKFNVISQTVTVLPVKLPYPIGHMAAASVGTNIYLFGGAYLNSSGVVSPDYGIFKFNTLTESITTLDAKFQWYSEMGVCSVGATAGGDKIYLCGGRILNDDGVTFSPVKGVLAFDTNTEQMTYVGEMQTALWGCGAVAIGDSIFVAGGDSEGLQGTRFIYRYNLADNMKSTYALMSTSVYEVGVAGVGSRVYVFGGGNSSKEAAQIRYMKCPTHECTITLRYNDSGADMTFCIPVTIYDKYRNYIKFEGLAFDSYKTYADFVYELNGERRIQRIYGEDIRSDVKLEIKGEAVYSYNEGTKTIGLVGMVGAIPEAEILPESPNEESPSLVLYNGEIYVLTEE